MNVDDKLIDTARKLLSERFPSGPGMACAAYGKEGRLYTGAASIEPESSPIEAAKINGELLVALITLAWDGPGSDVRVERPRPATLDRLQGQARRHAQVAVAGRGGDIEVRALWELVPDNPNLALVQGNFGHGMKAIGGELLAIAKDPGVPLARARFVDLMLSGLAREDLRQTAKEPGHRVSSFFTPLGVESLALRHVWLAFEWASEKLVFSMIDEQRPVLAGLGCNDQDVIHIKQGWEALRNSFGVLIMYAGTRRPVAKESPFNPYDASSLAIGVPIHEYIRFTEPTGDLDLVRQLAAVLMNRREGGFTSYLKQRNLFKIDLFNGGGTGICPFAIMSTEILVETARALEQGLRAEVVLLG